MPSKTVTRGQFYGGVGAQGARGADVGASEAQGPQGPGGGYTYGPPQFVEPSIAGHFMAMTVMLNKVVERAEKALAGLQLGVSAAVEMEATSSNLKYLCFGKNGKDWCLTVESFPPGTDPAEAAVTRLSATSRETRLRALALLPALEKELVKTAERQLNEATTTIIEAERYLTDLEARTK